MTVLYKRPIEEDGCSRVLMTKRARCSGCGQWINSGEQAFSYLPDPVDGNYVEHEACRYGTGWSQFYTME